MKPEVIRHEQILGRLSSDRKVSVARMAEDLAVSMETIRRDLKILESRGQLGRIHGGAVPVVKEQDRPLQERSRIALREKTAIAKRAVKLLKGGMSVFLDTGTTTLAVARELADVPPLTLFTNSLDIALLVGRQRVHKVEVTGGTYRHNDNALIGYNTLNLARNYHFDVALMGIVAIDAEIGFMDFEEHEAELRRTLVGQSRLRVILADHSKFGRPARIRTFELSAVDRLVTDMAPPPSFALACASAHVEIDHD